MLIPRGFKTALSAPLSTALSIARWLALAALLPACASFNGIKLAQDPHTELYVYPDSIQPHAAGKATDWRALLLVNFTARPRPGIADGRELLPLSGRPDINLNDCWFQITGSGKFVCIRSGLMEVVMQCGATPRKTYLTTSVVGLMGNMAQGEVVRNGGPETGSLRTAEPGSLMERAFDEVCGRPQAREAVARAAEQEAAQKERQRIEAAAAWRAAQAQQEAREKRLAEERQIRERTQAEDRIRGIDELLRKAETRLREGDDDLACTAAREAADQARATHRLGAAMATQQRICDQHERLKAQRRAQAQRDDERINRLCTGTPRVSREQAEGLARMLSVNPMSLSFNRLNNVYSGSCTMTVYHPRGVATCSVSLDGQGAVQRIGSCN